MRKCYFTLIEMVVALGILLAILTISTLALSGVHRTWQTMSSQDKKHATYRTIDFIAENAFRNAVPFYWRDSNNKEQIIFMGEENSVLFSYLHPVSDREQGGIRFLKIYRNNKDLIAEYRQRPIINNEDELLPKTKHEILASDIKDVTFIYADRVDKQIQWFDSWDVEERRNIPMAIQMEITFADDSKQIWLRRTAGNGQFQEWGRRVTPMVR